MKCKDLNINECSNCRYEQYSGQSSFCMTNEIDSNFTMYPDGIRKFVIDSLNDHSFHTRNERDEVRRIIRAILGQDKYEKYWKLLILL